MVTSSSGTAQTSDGRESFMNVKSQMESELTALKDKLAKSEAEVDRLSKATTAVSAAAEKDAARM